MLDDTFPAIFDAFRIYAMVGLIAGAVIVVLAPPALWHRSIRLHGLQNAPPSFLALCAIVSVIFLWPLIVREMLPRRRGRS
jgi:hypothetical protein